MAPQLDSIANDDHFAKVLSGFCRQINQMGTGDSIMAPCGWKTTSGERHFIFMTVVKRQSTYTMIASNTSEENGLVYHPHTAMEHPKIKFLTSMRFDNISTANIANEGVWCLMFQMITCPVDIDHAKFFYEGIIPYVPL